MKKRKEKKKLCNHNPNDLNTSLEMLNKRTMIYPPVDEYFCKICHQFFQFNKTT